MGIAQFISIPICTFSVTKIGTAGSSCARSELVRDDGWRKRACLVPGKRRWLCSCCGSAGTACWEWQSKTNSWWNDIPQLYQAVSITLAKMQGKWAFTIFPVPTIVHWSRFFITCWPPFSCHAYDYGYFSFVHTNFYFWEGPFDGLATVDMQPL